MYKHKLYINTNKFAFLKIYSLKIIIIIYSSLLQLPVPTVLIQFFFFTSFYVLIKDFFSPFGGWTFKRLRYAAVKDSCHPASLSNTHARAEPRNTLFQVLDKVLVLPRLNYNTSSTKTRPQTLLNPHLLGVQHGKPTTSEKHSTERFTDMKTKKGMLSKLSCNTAFILMSLKNTE